MRAIGARLPSDDAANAAPIDVPELFDATPENATPAQHNMHHGGGQAMPVQHDSPGTPSASAPSTKNPAGAKP